MVESWDQFVQSMHELNYLSVAVRLILATLFGATLGLDRTRKNRPAGLRTHMVVCLGAALVMLTNQFMVLEYGGDPARLGAQVISGIGFLGAGTIIVTRYNQVVGLTTAAGLWVSACIGLALGIGFYSGAFIAEFLIVVVVVYLHRWDKKLHAKAKVMEMYVEFESARNLSNFISYATNHALTVGNVEMISPRNPQSHIAALISIKLPKRFEHVEVLQQLGKLEGVCFIEEI